MKNLFLMFSISTIGMLAFSHSLTSGLNKSTLNQCTNNNDNKACNYLVENGSNYQKKIAQQTLLIRGF
tara:strand:- start:85 stop:288 length:204 start_codon:yes stop_codon:yes gene_type:complete